MAVGLVGCGSDDAQTAHRGNQPIDGGSYSPAEPPSLTSPDRPQYDLPAEEFPLDPGEESEALKSSAPGDGRTLITDARRIEVLAATPDGSTLLVGGSDFKSGMARANRCMGFPTMTVKTWLPWAIATALSRCWRQRGAS